MSPKDLDRVVMKAVSEKLEAKEMVKPRWLAIEIVNKMGSISGEGADFFLLCGRSYVYRVIKSVVKKFHGDQEEDGQQLLGGYEFLRVGYSFKREGEIQVLPIEACTDEELLSRSQEFDVQAHGLKRHAEELRNYVMKRALAA